MKQKALTILIATLFSLPSSAKDPQPNLLDPKLSHVNSSRFARIVAYRNCDSLDKCWSDVYFQLVFVENKKTPIKCTVKIKELEKKYIVSDSKFSWVHGNPEVNLTFAAYDKHKDQKLDYSDAVIIPEPDCTYKIHFYRSNV